MLSLGSDSVDLDIADTIATSSWPVFVAHTDMGAGPYGEFASELTEKSKRGGL